MRRLTAGRGAGLVAGLVLTVAGAAADPRVVDPDDRVVDRAVVVEDGGRTWVRDGFNLPLELEPDADGLLRLPPFATSRLLVLDAATGKPVTAGRLRWVGAGIPEPVAEAAWSARAGRLDLGCRGHQRVVLLVDGYRPATAGLEIDGRRRTVLLEPSGNLDLRLRPPAAGTLWLAARTDISVVNPFFSAARQHPVGADGAVTVADLDGAAEYEGVVVVPGKAPFVGRISELPQLIELRLEPGLAIAGRVLDPDRRPLADARVRAIGAVDVPEPTPHRSAGADPSRALDGTSEVLYAEGGFPTAFYSRDRLRAGNRIEGPAVVTETTGTTVIPPGHGARVDRWLNLLVTKGGDA